MEIKKGNLKEKEEVEKRDNGKEKTWRSVRNSLTGGVWNKYLHRSHGGENIIFGEDI